MKVLIFTDLHVHNYKDFSKGDSRLQNTLQVLNVVFTYAKKHGIKYILFCGDLYDNQKLLPTAAVNELISIFRKWSEEAPEITFYAISGNHDYATKNLIDLPGISAITHLEEVAENFRIIDNNCAPIIDKINKIQYCIFGIPYYEYPEHFKQALEMASSAAQDSNGNFLLMHQTPSGLGNESIPVDTNINDPLYDNFDYIFNGHIHAHAQLNDKFVNVGSPIHRDQADIDHDKGFLVFDLSTPKDGYKFVSLNKMFPTFIKKIEGDTVKPEEAKDFIQWIPAAVEAMTLNNSAEETAKFRTDVTPEQLLRNYCEQTGNADEELINVGLKFLK